MQKRILAAVLGAVLTLGLLPGQAFAAAEEGWVVTQLTPHRYNEVEKFASDGTAIAQVGWGLEVRDCLVDTSGKEIIPVAYNDILRVGADGLLEVYSDNGYGLANKEGELLFAPGNLQLMTDFSEGLIGIGRLNPSHQVCFWDTEGREVIPFLPYSSTSGFSEGLAAVQRESDGKWGFIDKTGQLVIPVQYDDVASFYKGRAAAKTGGKWGFIDKAGQWVIPAQFEYDLVGNFHDDRAAVKIGGDWGFIDPDGQLVIPAQYYAVYSFSNGVAHVLLGSKWRDIDRDGQPYTPEIDFIDGLKRVKGEKQKWGLEDTDGQMAVPCRYQDILQCEDGLFWAKEDGLWALYSAKRGTPGAAIELTREMFTVDTFPEVYTGRPHIKAVEGWDGARQLVEGTDYTVDHQYNIAAAGQSADDLARVVITGKGDYTGIVEFTFVIQREEETGETTVSDERILKSTNTGGRYSAWHRWDNPVGSYLYQDGAGLVRVERYGKNVVVETYSGDMVWQSRQDIPLELPLWGGCHIGERYNFIITGQYNFGESNSQEVFRVTRYDKNWNRLDHVSLFGANTYDPFKGGSLRCAEYNGYLYIYTCHEMYSTAAGDGRNHQASFMAIVREQDMTIKSTATAGTGYVSHSFNQFILVDQERNLVRLDHGDGYPRALVMVRYAEKAGQDWSSIHGAGEAELVKFSGGYGANETGGQVTDLAETATGYLAAFTDTGLGDQGDGDSPRDLYLSWTSKTSFSTADTVVRKVATTQNTERPGNAYLIPLSDQEGYLIWEMTEGDSVRLQYATYDADGNLGRVRSARGDLSDCHPIVWEGKVLWYTTDRSEPVFYTLDSAGVSTQAAALPPPVVLTPEMFTVDTAEERYTAAPIAKSIRGQDGERALTEGRDYTVRYSGNILPSTAKITITGRRGYTGQLEYTFSIRMDDQEPIGGNWTVRELGAYEAWKDSVHEGMVRVYQNGKYGFMDVTSGEVVVPCIYDGAGDFSGGLARVCRRNGYKEAWGYVDKTGKEVIECWYGRVGDFAEGRASVGRYFIDVNEKEYYDANGDMYEDSRGFSEGLAAVQKNGKWGFADTSGKVVIPCQYNIVGDFKEGGAWVHPDSTTTVRIDKTGKVLFTLSQNAPAPGDSYPMPTNGKDGTWQAVKKGYVDKLGQPVGEFRYEIANEFSEGMAVVYRKVLPLGGKYGYVDATGREVISPIYDRAEDFSDGLAAVKLADKWGYIDREGREVIPVEYALEWAGPFSEGFARVCYQGETKARYIDQNGQHISDGAYDIARDFSGGFAIVGVGELTTDKWGNTVLNGEWNCIDGDGKPVLDFPCEEIRRVGDGLLCVKRDGEWGILSVTSDLDPAVKRLARTMFTVDTADEFYTGSAIRKSVVGAGLTEGRDYTVSYTDNTQTGVAKITITGKGNYLGTLRYTFAIREAPVIDSGTMSGDDRSLEWVYRANGQIAVTGGLATGESVLAASYSADGRLTAVKQIYARAGTAQLSPEAHSIKLFWLDAGQAPITPSVTVRK